MPCKGRVYHSYTRKMYFSLSRHHTLVMVGDMTLQHVAKFFLENVGQDFSIHQLVLEAHFHLALHEACNKQKWQANSVDVFNKTQKFVILRWVGGGGGPERVCNNSLLTFSKWHFRHPSLEFEAPDFFPPFAPFFPFFFFCLTGGSFLDYTEDNIRYINNLRQLLVESWKIDKNQVNLEKKMPTFGDVGTHANQGIQLHTLALVPCYRYTVLHCPPLFFY